VGVAQLAVIVNNAGAVVFEYLIARAYCNRDWLLSDGLSQFKKVIFINISI
jgi:hypothetical protein